MIEQQAPGGGSLNRLIRAHVDREVKSADANSLITRIRQTRRDEEANRQAQASAVTLPPQCVNRYWARSLAWATLTLTLTLTAAAALMAFLGGRHLDGYSANAAVVLQNVRSEHARAIDHCYRVQFAPDPRFWDPKNKLAGPSMSILWTRGDRFSSSCTVGELQLKIGREANGTFWVSTSPSKGIRFTNDAAELPKSVAVICEINSMSVPQLVEGVLADFDLHLDPSTKRAPNTTTLVWAKLKPERTHPLLSDALLEIDSRTNVLNRLVLWTIRDGNPSGTVTYTLLQSGELGDDQYRLLSHLDGDAKIELHTFSLMNHEASFVE